MVAFKLKWVNSDYIWYRVNSLRLIGLQMIYNASDKISNNSFYQKMSGTVWWMHDIDITWMI